jgi:hypothetical protein
MLPFKSHEIFSHVKMLFGVSSNFADNLIGVAYFNIHSMFTVFSQSTTDQNFILYSDFLFSCIEKKFSILISLNSCVLVSNCFML